MKKEVLGLIFVLLIIGIVYAQEEIEIPKFAENRLPIEFHSVSGSESITLDLVKYFGRKADFVVGETEHVNVVIDPGTGMATITAIDPNWRGIEEVVFATATEYLVGEKVAKKELLPKRYRNLTKINVSVDKIALVSDAFTQEQFNTIIGKLTAEQIDIISFMSNTSLALAINDELTINFSTIDRSSPVPNINFDFKMPEGNLTMAYYEEGNDILYFSFILFGLGLLLILGIYVKYSWATPFREVFLKPKEKTEVSKAESYKKDLKINLRKIGKLVGEEKPGKLFKQTLEFATNFLSRGYGIKSSNYSAKLEKIGISSGTQSKIKLFFSEYKNKAYASSQIKDSDVKGLISFIESIIRGL
ncbi:MAG: hypothetical protein KKA65_00795 [Nanoarchaeota archaeon]|nr:hypothetical protein [Nanoarchaeota archaeon]MBU4241929.1 hypothetical protein [Nanoarchaeota archaeon]MBU4351900.1 hypothetical protein [Nanoarchaeota archaeon]MBU4456015.1 hypothetical protein [Nanoarchaeota archaeon]MCG2719956.1 hypothetical protein [Nanoarchaeota archaeon]